MTIGRLISFLWGAVFPKTSEGGKRAWGVTAPSPFGSFDRFPEETHFVWVSFVRESQQKQRVTPMEAANKLWAVNPNLGPFFPAQAGSALIIPP